MWSGSWVKRDIWVLSNSFILLAAVVVLTLFLVLSQLLEFLFVFFPPFFPHAVGREFDGVGVYRLLLERWVRNGWEEW
jgi:hypothetical protein